MSPFSQYDSFEPKPDVEEIPTFTFENERNLDNYKDRIFDKEALIEMNAKNYLSYMKKFEKKKANISSPYSVYLKLKQNNRRNDNDNCIRLINNNISGIDKINKDNNIINNRYSGNKENPINLKQLSNSVSMRAMQYGNRKSEITNPELFYKRNNEDYNKYRAELRQYLDYNYKVLMDNKKTNKKKEVNVNPYNPIDADFEHYKTDLTHNPILNPVNNYSFNKYLEKEIKGINKNSNTSTFTNIGNLVINK